MKRLEDQFQRNLNAWWRLQYPQTWKKTVHVPSEMPAKSRVSAAIAKGLGWKAGIPDILCFARRGGYSGLAIELKIGSNKPSDAQQGWLTALEEEGWRVGWFNNLDAARDFVDQYHAQPTQPPILVEGPLSKEALAAIEKSWRDRHTGKVRP